MEKRPTADLISTVLFDADGVLQRTDSGWHDTLVGLLGDRRQSEGEDFIAAIQRAEKPTMDGTTDIDEAMAEVLRQFSVEVDVSAILDVWTKIEPDQGMIDAVLELRREGILCCVATNQQWHRAQWMRANLVYSELFDETFYSCELGLAKPDPAYFTAILDRLDLDPTAVLFIDDTEVNVTGARSIGLNAELFPRHGGRPSLEEILARYQLDVPDAA